MCGTGSGNKRVVDLTWTDNSKNETGFTVMRGLSQAGPWTALNPLPPNTTKYTDPVGNTKVTAYFYQVVAENAVGYSGVPGYSTLTVKGSSSTVMAPLAAVTAAPTAPTNLTAVVQGTQIQLNWKDNSNNESGFVLQRGVNGGAFADLTTTAANISTYTDVAVSAGNSYSYRVAAVNGAGTSAFATTAAPAAIGATPAAPTGVTATAVATNKKSAQVTLTWTDAANNETGYDVQLATDAGFNNNLVTFKVAANAITYTTGNVASSTPFYFRVRAVNGSGPSVWTNATPFPIVTPAQP